MTNYDHDAAEPAREGEEGPAAQTAGKNKCFVSSDPTQVKISSKKVCHTVAHLLMVKRLMTMAIISVESMRKKLV